RLVHVVPQRPTPVIDVRLPAVTGLLNALLTGFFWIGFFAPDRSKSAPIPPVAGNSRDPVKPTFNPSCQFDAEQEGRPRAFRQMMVWHMAKTVLVVDDDPTQRRLMQAAAEKQGFRARVVENGERALEEASDARNGVDVVLLDLVMPGLSGMETLERLMERRPDLPVIVLTATGGIDTVVQAMRAGAIDFFVKPASPERIAISIRNALKLSDLRGEVKRLTKKAGGAMGFEDMIAGAPTMRQVVRLGQRAAASSIPILVLGESGVGKEVIARCIQGASERAGKPFISVNCGAI